jgi:tetratricopeptide (TPR) repeat protein
VTDARGVHSTHLDAETIAALIDRTLDPTARAAAEAHLAGCADCREIWMETSEIASETEVGGWAAAPAAADASAPRARSRRWIFGGAGLVAAAAAALFVANGWLTLATPGTGELLDEILSSSARARFTEARISRTTSWGPLPSSTRSGDLTPAVVTEAVRALADRAETVGTAQAFHDLGLARLATGNVPEAVTQLQKAAAMDPSSGALKLDLSAALLELCRSGCNAAEAGAALRAATEAWDATGSASAAFNRSLALERLGRAEEAAQSWRDYLNLDPDPNWRAEAVMHLTDDR